LLVIGLICNFAIASANNQKFISIKYEAETYYSYDELSHLLGQLEAEYPEIFNYSTIGKTWEGREIWLVKISDNVDFEEEEKKVFFTGGMHGDEHQSYQVIIYSIRALVENYSTANVNNSFTERVRNVINNTELFFIPMLNPDGCEAGTRKNARPNNCILGNTFLRGVDIARNSGYKWDLLDKYPFNYRRSGFPPVFEKSNIKCPILDFRSIIGEGAYRGPYPFSEPESQAIKQVLENHSISLFMDYHSSGNYIGYGWAWNHEIALPQESLMLSIAENISCIAECELKRGTWAPILGNMRDWILAEYGTPAFVMELPTTMGNRPLRDMLHGNKRPLPWKNKPILEICKTHVNVNLYFAERAIDLI